MTETRWLFKVTEVVAKWDWLKKIVRTSSWLISMHMTGELSDWSQRYKQCLGTLKEKNKCKSGVLLCHYGYLVTFTKLLLGISYKSHKMTSDQDFHLKICVPVILLP